MLIHNCSSIPVNITTDGSVQLTISNVFGYGCALMCIIGTLTNLANIIVLSQPSMRSPTNLVLTWLAIADLMTMIVYLPSVSHYYIFNNFNLPVFTVTTNKIWAYYQLVIISFVLISHAAAVWFTVVLALIRYLHLSLPTIGPQIANIEKTSYLIGIVSVLSVIFTIPNMMINQVKECTVNYLGNNTKSVYIYYEIFSIKKLEINFWIQSIIFKIVPSFTLSILTILLILKMQHIGKKRNKLISRSDSQKKKRENRVTLMLLMVVVLFLIIELPHGILMLGSNFSKTCEDIYDKLGNLIDFLTLVNESINFILYTTMSKQFRRVFLMTFCRGKCCQNISSDVRIDTQVFLTSGRLQWTCIHKKS